MLLSPSHLKAYGASSAADRIALPPRQFPLLCATEASQPGTRGTSFMTNDNGLDEQRRTKPGAAFWPRPATPADRRFVVVRPVRLVRHLKLFALKRTRSVPRCDQP